MPCCASQVPDFRPLTDSVCALRYLQQMRDFVPPCFKGVDGRNLADAADDEAEQLRKRSIRPSASWSIRPSVVHSPVGVTFAPRPHRRRHRP